MQAQRRIQLDLDSRGLHRMWPNEQVVNCMASPVTKALPPYLTSAVLSHARALAVIERRGANNLSDYGHIGRIHASELRQAVEGASFSTQKKIA